MDWLKHKFNTILSKLRNKLSSITRGRAEEGKSSVRSTIAGVEIGNFLIALSTTGLMALGAIPISLPILIILAAIFIVLGVLGRYVDAVEDDVERLLKYEDYIREGVVSDDSHPTGTSSVQQKDY